MDSFVSSPKKPARTVVAHGGWFFVPRSVGFILFALVLPLAGRAAMSRIGIRSIPNVHTKEFYDSATALPFVPRGNNYIRLAAQPDPWDTNVVTVYHSTFDPGEYDRDEAAAALADMRRLGYNVARVFINDLRVGNQEGGAGLSTNYLVNVADFLGLAAGRNMYVILTFPFLPKTGGYYLPPPNPDIEDINNFYLAQPFVEAKKRYLQDFIGLLQSSAAPLNTVFSYNLENEVCYLETAKPLSLASGTVSTANGGTYDLALPADRQQMMDANLVHWIDHIREGVRQSDPSALVGVGFFSPAAVEGPADPRVIRTYWAIADAAIGGSSVDYIDLHVYPGQRDLAGEMSSFEIGVHEKPLVMGEFGAFKHLYSTPAEAAYALREFQVRLGNEYGFCGWLLWTWDTEQQPDVQLFHARSGSGEIRDMLSPLVRLDPRAAIGPVKILDLSLLGSNAVVRWSGTDIDSYTLCYRTNLSSDAWRHVEPTNQPVAAGMTILTATNCGGAAAPMGFFRIEAR